MKFDDLEKSMRRLEVYHSLRVLPEAWMILRIDGRGFSRFTEKRFEKPFDPEFHNAMVAACERLMGEFSALYVYTESDEISVLLPRQSQLFDREVEKLVSLSAGLASSSLTLRFQTEVHCDSRLWVGARTHQVLEYFRWRQSDAARCCLNGWCYWKLRQAGHSVKEATAGLKGRSFAEKNEILFQHGVNFNEVPLWQRRGTGLYWKSYEKAGRNPVTGQSTTVTRRKIYQDEELPMGDAYAEFVRQRLV